jgi:hypothetical protein
MKDRTFQQVDAMELRRLLDAAGDDPILAPQLKDRLDEAERALAEEAPTSPQESPLPRTAIFLRGGGVQDSVGVRPTLAGEALIRYERMFVEQAIHDERMMAKDAGRNGRPRGSPAPELLFVGTPRGSFGLEFVPQTPDDPVLREIHVRALTSITDTLERLASSDSSTIDEIIRNIPSSVLRPMKLFMSTLAQYGAELRLAVQGKTTKSLSADQITATVARLDREVIEETVTLLGELRGVTLESGYFDFVTRDSEVISGTVSNEIRPDELVRIHQLTNSPSVATCLKTTVRLVSGDGKTSYTLLGARPVPAPSA